MSDDAWGMTVTADASYQLLNPVSIMLCDKTSSPWSRKPLHTWVKAETQQMKWRVSAAHMFCVVTRGTTTCASMKKPADSFLIQPRLWITPQTHVREQQTCSNIPGSWKLSYTPAVQTLSQPSPSWWRSQASDSKLTL